MDYPLIKSQVLRKVAEYTASALLIVTIGIGVLTKQEAPTMVCLGLFLMVGAFAMKGFRGGLSRRGPWLQPSKGQRIAMFTIGFFSLVLGITRLLRH